MPKQTTTTTTKRVRELSATETRQALQDLTALSDHMGRASVFPRVEPKHATDLLEECVHEDLGVSAARRVQLVWDDLMEAMALQEKLAAVLDRAIHRVDSIDDRLRGVVERRSGIT